MCNKNARTFTKISLCTKAKKKMYYMLLYHRPISNWVLFPLGTNNHTVYWILGTDLLIVFCLPCWERCSGWRGTDRVLQLCWCSVVGRGKCISYYIASVRLLSLSTQNQEFDCFSLALEILATWAPPVLCMCRINTVYSMDKLQFLLCFGPVNFNIALSFISFMLFLLLIYLSLLGQLFLLYRNTLWPCIIHFTYLVGIILCGDYIGLHFRVT